MCCEAFAADMMDEQMAEQWVCACACACLHLRVHLCVHTLSSLAHSTPPSPAGSAQAGRFVWLPDGGLVGSQVAEQPANVALPVPAPACHSSGTG